MAVSGKELCDRYTATFSFASLGFHKIVDKESTEYAFYDLSQVAGKGLAIDRVPTPVIGFGQRLTKYAKFCSVLT